MTKPLTTHHASMPAGLREQLIGYLLDAIDEKERAEVEALLRDSAEARQELQQLQQMLAPLEEDAAPAPPPEGLWQRTCRMVDVTSRVVPSSMVRGYVSRWRARDTVTAAAVLLAVVLLVFPAVSQSRFNAGVTGCQNNLRELGLSLIKYSEANGGCFPHIPDKGNGSFAGMYAPILRDHQLLEDARWILCPTAPGEGERTVRIPTCREINSAEPWRLVALCRQTRGDYGYNLGVIVRDKYCAVRNRNRTTFAIMSDAPSATLDGFPSANHGGKGQNVLFEYGNVRFVRVCRGDRMSPDNYFVNNQGFVAAGCDDNDAAVGPPHARPLLWGIPISAGTR